MRTLIPVTREEELEICARIKSARKEAGLTQAAMGELLAVELRTYQNYEHDRVPWRHLKKIGKLTGRTQEWLLRGDREDQSEIDKLTAEVHALRDEMRTALRNLALSRGTQTAKEAGQGRSGKRPSARAKPAPKKKKPGGG